MGSAPALNSKTIRLAAAMFLFVCVPLSLWDQFYVPQKIFVAQDPVATATNLLANEFIFRTAIVTHLIGIIVFVSTILMFAHAFKPVNKTLSQLMTAVILTQLPIIFILELINFSAMMILKSDARATFDTAQQQEAAYFLIRIYRYGVGPGLGKLFFGLCFFPFGMLVLRSGVAPRIIGILLIIGGVGYITDCCISVLLQRADYIMVRSYLMYTTVAYFLAYLWFLIKGVREPVVVNQPGPRNS